MLPAYVGVACARPLDWEDCLRAAVCFCSDRSPPSPARVLLNLWQPKGPGCNIAEGKHGANKQVRARIAAVQIAASKYEYNLRQPSCLVRDFRYLYAKYSFEAKKFAEAEQALLQDVAIRVCAVVFVVSLKSV